MMWARFGKEEIMNNRVKFNGKIGAMIRKVISAPTILNLGMMNIFLIAINNIIFEIKNMNFEIYKVYLTRI